MNAHVQFADNKPVICPAVCITHSLCHSDILSVLPSYYDIINEMPVFGARMHPWRLIASWQIENCVSDQQFMLCTLLQKEEAIAVALFYSFSPNHFFPGLDCLTYVE